jgi:hypothetical protein
LEKTAWELLEEVCPPSLFYFGVKVGDGLNRLLILGHPNPLSPARAWVRSGGAGKGPRRGMGSGFGFLRPGPSPRPTPRGNLSSKKNTLSLSPKGSWTERKSVVKAMELSCSETT